MAASIAQCAVCAQQEAKGSGTVKAAVSGRQSCSKLETSDTSEDLCFSIDQLIATLKNAAVPIGVLSVKISPDNFTMNLIEGIRIAGCHNRVNHRVIDLTVFGKGSKFKECVDRVTRLASAGREGPADLFAMPFMTAPPSQEVYEEYVERDGTRYHMQKLSGAYSFHCCNARADDRAILKAQP